MTDYVYRTYRCEWRLEHGTIDQYGQNFTPYETHIFPSKALAETERNKVSTLNKYNGLWKPNNAPHSYCETRVTYFESINRIGF